MPISDINEGEARFEDLRAGELVTYTGVPQRIYRGYSDSFKVDLKAGHRVVVCKNQDKDGLGFLGKIKVVVHVTLQRMPKPVAGHGSDCYCACGACGHTWELLQDAPGCDCEQEGPHYNIHVVRLYKDLVKSWAEECEKVRVAMEARHAGAAVDEGAAEDDVDELIKRAQAKIKEAYWTIAKARLDAGIPSDAQ